MTFCLMGYGMEFCEMRFGEVYSWWDGKNGNGKNGNARNVIKCPGNLKGSHLHAVKAVNNSQTCAHFLQRCIDYMPNLVNLAQGFCLSAKCCHKTCKSTALF